MARILVVGCGCRGRALASALAEDGHAVRGTTRDHSCLGEVEAAGADAVVADPDRLGTLLPAIEGVSALCWLMGTADANADALHGPRLASLVEMLVDTHVRGVVYEAAGSVPPELVAGGAEIVRRAGATYGMPVEIVEADPAGHERWLSAMRSAVSRLFAG
ncbi:MAG: NAD(P)H-binding protein [Thermoleophilaceae bacterium]